MQIRLVSVSLLLTAHLMSSSSTFTHFNLVIIIITIYITLPFDGRQQLAKCQCLGRLPLPILIGYTHVVNIL